MDISVVICTYNREKDLRLTLESFLQLKTPDGVSWELLVVDNNSSDKTREVCESFAGKLPLRYRFEERQGQAAALNHAVRESDSGLLLFTDDDVNVDPDWLVRYHAAAKAYTEASFFGGAVVSHWMTPPPRWFAENAEWLRTNPRVDYGKECVSVTQPEQCWFIGANIAFRRAVFDSGLKFREDRGCIGRFGTKNSSHSDVNFELQEILFGRGEHGRYVPDAVIYHRDPPERMTEEYIRYYYVQNRIEQVLRGRVAGSPSQLFGVPRYLWRKLVGNVITYVLRRLTGPSRVWLQAEVQAAAAWGDIKGFRRLKQESPEDYARACQQSSNV